MIKGGNGPLAVWASTHTGCGYPHMRLVMHVLNCSRHATAQPNMAASRQVVRSTNYSTNAAS